MNSAGLGYCDDSAALFQELMTALGYTARTWGLNGHVVAEAFVNGRWEMWDPDLEVYYRNRDGLVAGAEELANDPTLITQPIGPILPVSSWPYQQEIADIYGTKGDNFIHPPETLPDYPLSLEIPAGGAFEFPDVYDAPVVTRMGTFVPSYANARLIVPAGFAGTVASGLMIHSIGWSGTPRLSVLTRNAAGIWDAQPTEASWVVDGTAPIVTASQPSGHYNLSEPVSLPASEPAAIYYTIDGATPTEASAAYTAPIAMPAGGVVKFFAIDSAGNRGRVRGYGPAAAQATLEIASAGATSVVFSATASGGTGIYEYKYLLRDTHAQWSVVRRYGPDNTWTWDKTGAEAGSYLAVVWVRNAGSTAEFEAEAWVTSTVKVNRAPALTNPGDRVDADVSKTYPEIVLTDAPLAYLRLGDSGTTA